MRSINTDTQNMKIKIKNHVHVPPPKEDISNDPERQAQLREDQERREAFARLKASWPPGTLDQEFMVAELVRKHYGIPRDGAHWLLRCAPYKPPEVHGYDFEYLPGKFQHYACAWSEADIHVAARRFAAECTKVTASLWSHPKIAGRFKLRPPADQVSAAPAKPVIRPRAGREVPTINLRRISPDDLADARGFADDWALDKLHQESLSSEEIGKLAFLKYGLPRSATTSILHFLPYKPEPIEWRRLPRPRGPLIGVRWRPQDAHRAVLTFISECKPEARHLWSHPRVKERFKLTTSLQ